MLRKLFAMRAPKIFITVVLLLSWMEPDLLSNKFQVLDFFAGKGRIARGARYVGMPAAAVDVEYADNARVMDINSDPGYALLSCIWCVQKPDKHGVIRFHGTAELKGTQVYPVAYARRVLDIVEICHVEARQVDHSSSLLDMYISYPWGDLWADADVTSVFNYLR
ncbi:unnamed protein product, partial [Symbiodinium necroappetens]